MRMRRKKWARPELAACPYFVQEAVAQKGNWHARFPAQQPLCMELGCGKASFVITLALRHPERNYIGLDMISDVLGVARRKAEAVFAEAGKPIDNLLFTAYDITRIENMMDQRDAIDALYINFCNPWPKDVHKKKRLTHTRQLEKYKLFLVHGAHVYFKTDHEGLYRDSLRYFADCGYELLHCTEDLYASLEQGIPELPEHVVTEHEQMFVEEGKPIYQIIARYP